MSKRTDSQKHYQKKPIILMIMHQAHDLKRSEGTRRSHLKAEKVRLMAPTYSIT